jgi:hypothetical protein
MILREGDGAVGIVALAVAAAEIAGLPIFDPAVYSSGGVSFKVFGSEP